MSLDFPAMGQALWALSDATGIRPEYMLPVLYLESNFQPGIVNSIGCSGINQLCQNIPAGYTSWLASQQMNGVVTPMFESIVRRYGPLLSATRVYQANLLPATLSSVRKLSDVLAVKGSSVQIAKGLTQGAVYSANFGLDANQDGVITLQDIANKMAQMVSKPAVQTAIASAYLLRPNESPNGNPVYGDDFPWKVIPWTDVALIATGVTALAAGVLAFVRPEVFSRI